MPLINVLYLAYMHIIVGIYCQKVTLKATFIRLYAQGFTGVYEGIPIHSEKKIRTRLPKERSGSDYIGLVRVTGVEPARLSAREPKSRMSANSIIPAFF